MENTFKANFTGESEELPNVNQPLRFLTASSVIGDTVLNNDGEDMGSIKDVMLDIRSGKIEYYIIEFGGFLGIGEKYFAIPFSLLSVDPDNKVFRFNEKKETLEKAPGFNKEHWPETNWHSNYVTDSWSFWG
ncbi:MAG: PRC-barrel domain-containing protein [Ferruginibacter sp.]|nr:PRC-barrel domain-containing protein [Ferruginibacter sp.]